VTERGAGERGFEDELACTLAVWSAGASTAVPGANLKRLQLSLAPHGFRGEVVFWVRADDAGEALHQVLTGDAPIEIEVGVARAHTWARRRRRSPCAARWSPGGSSSWSPRTSLAGRCGSGATA